MRTTVIFIITFLASLQVSRAVFRSACFGNLGCFNNSAPFDNTYEVLPDPPESINTKFLVVTKKHGHVPRKPKPHLLRHTEDTEQLKKELEQVHFVPQKHTKIIIHGFTQSASAEWIRPMVHALLAQADVNILLVDWGNGARFPHYLQAAANIRLVGEQLRQLLQKLVKLGLKMSNVHMIGHSLGAHVATHAGKGLGEALDQITGLDPAEPLFQNQHRDVRLDETDAVFVDVVHTNGKPVYMGGYGVMEPSGHADFFVNGGANQPGCLGLESTLADLLEGDTDKAFGELACSHSRAHDIYTESVTSANNNCHFVAYPCNDTDWFNSGHCLHCSTTGCQKLGYHVKIDRPRGKFFLKTRHKSPFCGHHNRVSITSRGNGTAVGRLSLKFVQGHHSSHEVFLVNQDRSLTQQALNTVVVTQHALTNLTAVHVTYHRHESWLPFMSGDELWRPDRITISTGETETPRRYRVICDDMEIYSGETKYMKAVMIK